MDMFVKVWNSVMDLNEIYFWTATISKWRNLLQDDLFKKVLIDSLTYLSSQKKIVVYAFVIMPNHIHIIWEMLEMNGKEKPYASFLKFTAHQIQENLIIQHPELLKEYEVKEETRHHRFWKRDSLAIKILSREMLEQKLEYCHNNPLQAHWNLALEPEGYYYSSAFDYANNMCRFSFLQHYWDRV